MTVSSSTKYKTMDWMQTVSLGDIALVALLVVALFNYATVWTGLSGAQLVAVRLACLVPCLFNFVFKFPRKKLRDLDVAVFLYAALRVAQGLFAMNPGFSVLVGLLSLLVFTVPSFFSEKYGSEKLLSLLFWLFLAVTVSMDCFSFATHGNGFLVQESEWVSSSYYIFGNKFLLAYVNMLFYGLCIYKFRHIGINIAVAVLCIFACSSADCSTGIVGILTTLVVSLFYKPLKHIIARPWFVCVLIVLMAVVAIVATGLFQLPAANFFITTVLGRDSDLTGRLGIYPYLMSLWLKAPIFGYGSDGSANFILMTTISAVDTQEGLFQILFSNGLIGALLFLAICYFSMRNISVLDKRGVGIYAFVISMALCSLVEINLSGFFLFGVSLVYVMTSDSARFQISALKTPEGVSDYAV